MTPQQNTEAVEKTRQNVLDHCMCSKLQECDYQILVIFPTGHYPEGVRCDFHKGKRVAFEKVLEVMERTWKESFP